MSTNLIAKRYAKGLLKLLEAAGEDLIQNSESIFLVSKTLFSDKEVAKFFESPVTPVATKIELVNDVLRSAPTKSENLSRFLERLILAGRASALPQVCQELKSQIDLKSGVIRAEVVSAHELDDSEKQNIEQKIRAKLGQKAEVQYLVDGSLLAGALVKIGHRSFDVSIQSNLNDLVVATQQ